MKLAGAYIEEAKHLRLTEMAKRNHRTLADQLRHIYDLALNGELKPRPARGTRSKSHARRPRGGK